MWEIIEFLISKFLKSTDAIIVYIVITKNEIEKREKNGEY